VDPGPNSVDPDPNSESGSRGKKMKKNKKKELIFCVFVKKIIFITER
jgi:hypothetical protein